MTKHRTILKIDNVYTISDALKRFAIIMVVLGHIFDGFYKKIHPYDVFFSEKIVTRQCTTELRQ